MIKQFQPCIAEVSRAEVSQMIECEHYLRRWPGVVMCTLAMRIAAERCGLKYDRSVGVLVFALPPRETSKRYGGVTWELARLWIDDEMPRNSESWFISQAVRHVRQCHPEVECLVSYADPSAGHQGTIYRAANWIQDGRTDMGRKTPRCDYFVDGKKYSRKAHVPEGATAIRLPRVSKNRFVFYMHGHEWKRSKVGRSDQQ